MKLCSEIVTFQLCLKYASKQILVKIWCLKYKKMFETLIISRSQGIYWHAHKTDPLTSIQQTLCVCGEGGGVKTA